MTREQILEQVKSLEIHEFKQGMEEDVIGLILPIQTQEFELEITRDQQPDLMNIPEYYQVNNGNFWCAIVDGKVVGTIALIDIGNDQLVMRKMFVNEKYRGTPVAKSLLDKSFEWAKEKGCNQIYLGTTSKFLAAHKFYEKHEFKKVSEAELPENFPRMKVDTVFYVKEVE